jgi:hypothetical protein
MKAKLLAIFSVCEEEDTQRCKLRSKVWREGGRGIE